MPKSKTRRRRGTTNEATANNAPTLENDLSVIVDGDKVVPNASSKSTSSANDTSSKSSPRLGVTYARKTGQPVITVASADENRGDRSGETRALQSARNTMPAYGPDGTLIERAQSDAAPSAEPMRSEELEATDGRETKDDLRQIAKTVSLSPEPEESVLRKVTNGIRAFASRLADVSRNAWTFAGSYLARHDIRKPSDVGRKLAAGQEHLAQVALALRVGLGALFVIGGTSKLSQLLSPAASDAMVANYTSTTGYINEFFMAFLFAPSAAISATPWSFLTALSAFELVTGLMLLAGLLVRPVALIYAFLLWSFVIALPVVTTNGVDPGVKTYMAPAILVQIRDIALSGMMFALYGLGAGLRSVDHRLFGPDAIKPVISSEAAGLLLRLSAAVVLLVGGMFAGMPNIKTYIEPGMLLVVVALALLWGGRVTRYAAGVACAVLVVYMFGKLGLDKGVIGNLNAIKRELALFAGAYVLAARDFGHLWTASDVARRLQAGTACAIENVNRPSGKLEPAE